MQPLAEAADRLLVIPQAVGRRLRIDRRQDRGSALVRRISEDAEGHGIEVSRGEAVAGRRHRQRQTPARGPCLDLEAVALLPDEAGVGRIDTGSSGPGIVPGGIL